MFNPPNSYPDPGSYLDLLKRITQQMQQKKVDEQLLQIVQQAFEKELDSKHIVLSRPEMVRLYQQVAKSILTETLEKIDNVK